MPAEPTSVASLCPAQPLLGRPGSVLLRSALRPVGARPTAVLSPSLLSSGASTGRGQTGFSSRPSAATRCQGQGFICKEVRTHSGSSASVFKRALRQKTTPVSPGRRGKCSKAGMNLGLGPRVPGFASLPILPRAGPRACGRGPPDAFMARDCGHTCQRRLVRWRWPSPALPLLPLSDPTRPQIS